MAKRYMDGGSTIRMMGGEMSEGRRDRGPAGALKVGPSMIKEDLSKFCNLPDEVINKEWPGDYEVMGYSIPADKYNAVKSQKAKDLMKFRENFSAGKY